MSSSSEVKKWNTRYEKGDENIPAPAQVLMDYQYLLPAAGCALDLACGRGANACLLAQHGLNTSAWDISDVAVERLNHHAAALGLDINCLVRDVCEEPPSASSFEVIVVTRFLHRKLIPALVRALRPGGLIFYQTFTKTRINTAGPRNPDYLLETNELLRLFSELSIVIYREEGRIGDHMAGFRNEAMLIAQK